MEMLQRTKMRVDDLEAFLKLAFENDCETEWCLVKV
jgi:hypothetical protein